MKLSDTASVEWKQAAQACDYKLFKNTSKSLLDLRLVTAEELKEISWEIIVTVSRTQTFQHYSHVIAKRMTKIRQQEITGKTTKYSWDRLHADLEPAYELLRGALMSKLT